MPERSFVGVLVSSVVLCCVTRSLNLKGGHCSGEIILYNMIGVNYSYVHPF